MSMSCHPIVDFIITAHAGAYLGDTHRETNNQIHERFRPALIASPAWQSADDEFLSRLLIVVAAGSSQRSI
jgi:hypothetical protein